MDDRFELASGCLKALAHPIRLKILKCLKGGGRSVTEIENFCQRYTQSNISQHLALMKSKGIIKSDKDGNQVFYSVRNRDIYRALDMLSKILCKG